MPQSCGSPSAAHCGNPVVNEALNENAATVSGRGNPNRSLCRLKNVRKNLDTNQSNSTSRTSLLSGHILLGLSQRDVVQLD